MKQGIQRLRSFILPGRIVRSMGNRQWAIRSIWKFGNLPAGRQVWKFGNEKQLIDSLYNSIITQKNNYYDNP